LAVAATSPSARTALYLGAYLILNKLTKQRTDMASSRDDVEQSSQRGGALHETVGLVGQESPYDEHSSSSWEILDHPLKTIGVERNDVAAAVTRAWKTLPEKRDWATEFFAPTSFSLPSIAEFNTRLQANLRRFQHNYLYVFALGVIVAVLMNPFFLLSVACVTALGRYAMTNAIVIKNYELSKQEKMGVIGGLAMVINWLCGTFHTLFIGILIGFTLVGLHVVLHNPFARTPSPGDAKNSDVSEGATEV